jgi:hypothetical protein
MRLVPKHWHTETWVCSMRGHQTPAARVVLQDAVLLRLIAINKGIHAIVSTPAPAPHH